MPRVLVIDDDPDLLTIYQKTLVAAGYDVITASSGSEALKQLRLQPVELIVTDLFMKEMDGIELIRCVRQDFPALRIIAMSGNPNTGANVLNMASHFGVAAVLTKPFSNQTLLDTVAAALK